MYHDKPRRSRSRLVGRSLAVLILVAGLLWGASAATRRVGGDLEEQAAKSLRKAVMDAVIQCYAVEGAYPEDLHTLETEYGLQINHQHFIVTYDVYASNQLPDVDVLVK